MKSDSKITKTDFEVDRSMVLDKCCEPDCGITIMVDKDMKDKGRRSRCTSCLMRFKLKK